MIEYGKLSFDVAFNPSTAFPLDARSYFDSYEAAVKAAAGAAEVGSSSSVYYFGQTLSVVEDGIASFYIIQPDKSLKVVGSDEGPIKVLIDENQFAYTEDNKLVLKDADSASEGQVLAMSAGGALAWVTPVDAYSKTETDNKISSAVAAASHLKRKIVDSIDLIDKNADDADQYIYMVPKTSVLEGDHYDEYMVIEIADTKFVEKVGDWSIDLSAYAKTADIEANYIKKNGTDRLITEAEGFKIAESEKNVIASVSSDFSVDGERQLSLNNISISKVVDLQDELNKKVNAKDGYTLLSPTDQEKLTKLTVGDSGNLEVSGSVNASNVKELDQWINDNRNTVTGLFNDEAKVKLEALFDQTSSEFEIATVGDDETGHKKQLNLVSVSQDKVTGLVDKLTELANVHSSLEKKIIDTADELNAKFANYVTNDALITKLNDYATVTDVNELKDILTWKILA